MATDRYRPTTSVRVNRAGRRRRPGPSIDLARPAADRAALLRFIGGRARINAVRKFRALVRQSDLLGLLLTMPLGAWPVQRDLADHFDVSQQTISRDLRAILQIGADAVGTWRPSADGWERRAAMRVGTPSSPGGERRP